MRFPSKPWDGKGAFTKMLEMKATKEEWKLIGLAPIIYLQFGPIAMYITSTMMHNCFHMQHGVPTIGFPNLTHKYEK
jgi:hypothetical protein